MITRMKNLIVLNDMGGSVMNVSDIPCTLRSQMKHHEPIVCYAADSHPMDSRFEVDGDISPTVTAKLAKGSADDPLVIVENGQDICD